MRPVSLLRASVLGLCLPGCAQVLGLDAFDQLAEGAACGQLVGSWECGPGLQCHDVQKVCVKVGAGGNGGGGAGGCEVGTSEACYTGPAGTEEVGDCHGGTRTCETGGVWGACTGEVKPGTESCTLPGDEDCDGQSNEEGADCTCVPGDMAPCYTGPMGTEGVGECKGGMGVCAASGTGVESCAGDVVPVQETCNDTRDEDCNGFACGVVSWVKFIPGAFVEATGADADGNVYVVGSFGTPVDFGGGTIIPGTQKIFVLKLDSSGTFQWVTTGAGATLSGLAVSPSGETFLSGYFASSVDFGCGLTSSTGGGADGFFVKLAADGTCAWTTVLEGAGEAYPGALSVSPAGIVRGAVSWTGEITTVGFPGGPSGNAVVRLDPTSGAISNVVDLGTAQLLELKHDVSGNWIRLASDMGSTFVAIHDGVTDQQGSSGAPAAQTSVTPLSDGGFATLGVAYSNAPLSDFCLNATASMGNALAVEISGANGGCTGGAQLSSGQGASFGVAFGMGGIVSDESDRLYVGARMQGDDVVGGVPTSSGVGTNAGQLIVALDPTVPVPSIAWVFQVQAVSGSGNFLSRTPTVLPTSALVLSAVITNTNAYDVGGTIVGGELGSYVAVVGR